MRGQGDLVHRLERRARLSGFEHQDTGGDVREQSHVGPLADGGVALEQVFLLGNPIPPARAVRPARRVHALGGDRDHPVERGVKVGREEQPVLLVAGGGVGASAFEHGMDLPASPVHHEDLVPHPTVLDAEQQ